MSSLKKTPEKYMNRTNEIIFSKIHDNGKFTYGGSCNFQGMENELRNRLSHGFKGSNLPEGVNHQGLKNCNQHIKFMQKLL